MSNTGSLAQRIDREAGTAASAEQPVRPKVMRRPSHFSSAPVVAEIPAIAPLFAVTPLPQEETVSLLPPSSSLSVIAQSKPWQEDARFGMAMVVILVLINVGLMFWLPTLRPAAHVAAPVVTQQEATPEKAPEPITLYTKPTDAAADDAPVVHVLGEPSANQ